MNQFVTTDKYCSVRYNMAEGLLYADIGFGL